jgi:DNA-binding NtrC family response regulator
MEAKILVVDDDSDICEDAKNYFQGEVISVKSIVVETTTDFSKAISL